MLLQCCAERLLWDSQEHGDQNRLEEAKNETFQQKMRQTPAPARSGSARKMGQPALSESRVNSEVVGTSCRLVSHG